MRSFRIIFILWLTVPACLVRAHDEPSIQRDAAVVDSVGRPSAAGTPAASELLDRYSQALNATQSFVCMYESSDEYGGHMPPDWGGGSHFSALAGKVIKGKKYARGEIRCDDGRIYYQAYQWGDVIPDEESCPRHSPMYNLIISNGRITYSHNKTLNSGWPGRASRHRPGGKATLNRLCGIDYMVGYVAADIRLDGVLRHAGRISVRPQTQKLGDSDCFILEADTKYGRYTVWIDPNHGYHAARIVNESKEGQYHGQHLLKKGDIAREFVTNVRFEQAGELWVPAEADVGYHRTVGSPEYYSKEWIHLKRMNIILNPDHDRRGSFADPLSESPANDPELENGTRVQLNRVSTELTWHDGHLVDDNGRKFSLGRNRQGVPLPENPGEIVNKEQ